MIEPLSETFIRYYHIFLGGWNADGKGPNIWDTITHERPNFIKNNDTADIACDSYHKYKEDVQLLKEMGANHYRFSLSWSRILPTGKQHYSTIKC